jgi:putative FmdB family regulatory protein
MLFPYECQKCSKRFDSEFPIGRAPRGTRCPACKGMSRRVYSGTSIMLKANGANGGISRSSSFGEEMKTRNTEAGRRMRRNRTPPKLLGYSHTDGRITEA